MKPMFAACRSFGGIQRILLSGILAWLFEVSAERAWGQQPADGQAPRQSIVLSAEGDVALLAADVQDWTPAKAGQVLRFGDRLRTGQESRATVRLADFSVLRVNELTTLQILPPAAPGKTLRLDLKNGSVFFFSREKPNELEFTTPLASGAIRGTEFLLSAGPGGETLVSLFDGEIVLRNELGEVALAAGEEAIVEAGKAPSKSPMIEAVSRIQWCLYYPAVLDPRELGLPSEDSEALRKSITLYLQGDLLGALQEAPEADAVQNPSARVYLAALQLAVGQVARSRELLNSLPDSPLAGALGEMVATVQRQAQEPARNPSTATEWMARSYYHQSRSDLSGALDAARRSTELAPDFGFAWARLAEMEFAFGRARAAEAALARGLALSPRNAQAITLEGFILFARNRPAEAEAAFSQAIEADGAHGNAWIGRGLARIRLGEAAEGRKDLETAAALEPRRSSPRNYLGKAYAATGDAPHAENEFRIAKQFDPGDPTPWLYSALFNQQRNHINEAVRDLERSQELNDNRSIFRSRLLLDQDRSVRSANLASIYRDAGMFDASLREAGRAAGDDFASFSSHLFLANSYAALSDPKRFNLRHETPRTRAALMSFLLTPPGASPLSYNHAAIDRLELAEAKSWGVNSLTEYTSNGDWTEQGTHYGAFEGAAYGFDAFYRSENGHGPNNDLEQLEFYGQFKQRLNERDSIFFQAGYYQSSGGDVAQRYQQSAGNAGLRMEENHEPNVFMGFHREWSPGVHTLLFAGRIEGSVDVTNPAQGIPFFRQSGGQTAQVIVDPLFSLDYSRDFTGYSAEAQQIWQTGSHSTIAGAAYQSGVFETTSKLRRAVDVRIDQFSEEDMERASAYVYHLWQISDPLRLTLGASYDWLKTPLNLSSPPLVSGTEQKDQLSPKIGIEYAPWKGGFFRAMYARSLGGVSFENSLRLEPAHVAGYNQAFRSLIPESNAEAGATAANEFETIAAGFEQKFPTGTYAGIDAQILRSDTSRMLGAATNSHPILRIPDRAWGVPQEMDFQERSLLFNINQLLSSEWSAGARYRLSEARLESALPNLPASVPGAGVLETDATSVLHQLHFLLIYNHSSGFFTQWETSWHRQSNRGYQPDRPGDDFWQHGIYAGYRFSKRRAEIRAGLLNLAGQDYELNPLNYYADLPRERTLAVRFKLNY